MEIKEELQIIQNYIEITCSNDPDEIMDRLSTLNVYLARSTEMYANARQVLRAKKTSKISETIISIAKESHLSANVQNALLDSICDEESKIAEWCERQNRCITHQMDVLRSILSYVKEDRKATKYGN